MTAMPGLRALVVEESTAGDRALAPLLRASTGVRDVVVAPSSLVAIRLLQAERFDLAVIDVAMPELNGLELGAVAARLAESPAIVLVADDGAHADGAYDVGAVDYLHRPVEVDRLAAAVRRATVMALGRCALAEQKIAARMPLLPAVPVGVDGVVQYVRREDVQIVEARNNRVRLHTPPGPYEARMALSTVEEIWRDCGFLRVHRSYLVSVPAVRELRLDSVGGTELVARTEIGDVPVSRKQARALRAALRSHGWPGTD